MNNDADIDSFPLDDATLELMAETQQQLNALRAYREGILALFIRQHKLGPGNWRLAENAKELVRAPQPQPTIPTA